MPTISSFYGILIRMFYNDHSPPHFHARYGEFEATIGIEELAVLDGELPPRALRLVVEWADAHREELMVRLAVVPDECGAGEDRTAGLVEGRCIGRD